MLHIPSRHRYTSSRHSNEDEEVCPEAGVKEEGQTAVVVVVVVVRNWLGSCVCCRIGSAGLTVSVQSRLGLRTVNNIKCKITSFLIGAFSLSKFIPSYGGFLHSAMRLADPELCPVDWGSPADSLAATSLPVKTCFFFGSSKTV